MNYRSNHQNCRCICSGLTKFNETLRNTPTGLKHWISRLALFYPLTMKGQTTFLRILLSKKIC